MRKSQKMKISLEKGDFTDLKKLAVAFMDSAKAENVSNVMLKFFNG